MTDRQSTPSAHTNRSIKYIIWRLFKYIRDIQRKKRYRNTDISIISMNCTGAILCHDLGLKFLSPTVNLFFEAEDFIKFCENLDHYLSIDEITQVTDSRLIDKVKYPVGQLDDIRIHFMHYNTFDVAKKKWNERKKRIRRDKLVIMACDRDGMNESLISRFQNLPYKKVMFCHKPYEDYKDCIYIKGFENQSFVGIITDPYGWTGKRPVDQFDWIEFLNDA